MPPRGVKKGTKRARQYEHIKESLEEQGRSESTAEEIAARTVNKERARHGEARASSKLSREDISSGRRGGLRSDVAMAILFAVCFAIGVILLRARGTPHGERTFDPEQLLFGNILLVGRDDLWVVLGIAVVTLGFVVFAWTRLAYATFDEELARLSGIEVGWLESALLALLAAVIVAAIRLAGVVLVSAFLVIPAAAGRIVGRSLVGVVAWAMLASVLGVLLGFMVAHRADWPAGATIVLVLAVTFAGAVGFRRIRG